MPILVLLASLVAAGAQNIFVNIRTSGSTPSTSTINPPAGNAYSAAAPVSGTAWNNVSRTTTVPQGTTAGTTSTLYNGLALVNSAGAGVSQTLTVSYYSAVTTGSRTEPSTATGENTLQPGGVMAEAWRNYLNASGNYFTFTISNLPASTACGVYLYGGTGTSGQGVGLTLAAANQLGSNPTNAFTTNSTGNSAGSYGALWTGSGGKTNLVPQGTTWNTLYGQSDASGVLAFRFVGPGSYAYFNGFQLVPLSSSGLGALTNQTVVAGSNATLSTSVTGLPVPNLQWHSNDVAIAGATNASLVLNNVQYSQAGAVYSLVASNLLGVVTNSMTLTVIVTPAITDLSNQAAPVGSNVTIPATVSGVPAPALRWQFNGDNVSDGATGNGSTLSGSTAGTLMIANAQAADSGTYSLVASNRAGVVTNSMTLTVSSGNVAPGIVGPSDQTVVQSSNATFSASVSGLPLPTLQWRVNGTNIIEATNSLLTVTNVPYAQNGWVYSIVASNSAGQATNSATLYVLVPPHITAQPTNVAILVGNSATFTVTAGGVPAVSYQWNKNGSPIANATNAAHTVTSAQGNDSGNYSVVVSNSVGTVTSSNATLTVLSTMTGTFLPTNGAVNISPDQQLRILFSGGTPKLAYSGKKLYVRDAADNSLFATIDTSLFQTFATDSATVSNAFIRTVQGQDFFYMPLAVYGNEAWITLNPTNRFAYGKTYHVTCDPGLFLDSTGAAFPGVTGTNTWRFSTRAAGPAPPTASTGPTNITVALDGAGDFATLQGASDWIPQNNTLKRTVTIQPGLYRDFACFYQNRNYVTVMGAGANRQGVQIIYPNAAFTSGSSCGLLHVECTDLYFRNLTLDNQVYVANDNNNYGPWAGRLNTLVTTSDRLIFENVAIKGGQDTLYAISGSAYYNRCEIWGSVDYIYGAALAVFDQCNIVEIRSTGGPITAPNTAYAAPYGLVFLNCNFPRALVANGYPYDVGTATTTFQRPWGQDGYTAIINCAVGSQFTTKGWAEWSGRETTGRAREYGTTLIGGGSVTPAQRQSAGAYWLNTFDPDYTNNPSLAPTDALLSGSPGTNNRVAVTINPADYTLPAIFGNSYYNLNGWLPTTLPTITAQPTNQTVSAGSPAAFSVAAVGVPDPAFQWRKNGTNIANATNVTFTIPSAKLADNATYSVVVSNSAGVVTSSNAVLTVPAGTVSLTPTFANGALTLSWPAAQTGFRLLAQTNPPDTGLTTNWQVVANSTATNLMIVPIDVTNGSGFFRLIYP
jgi:pectin methylesterase-like acyl-CoA thioesterase